MSDSLGYINLFIKKWKKADGTIIPKPENAPSYQGVGNIKGHEVEAAGWMKKDKNGNQYLSIQIKPPYQQQPRAATPQPSAASEDVPWPTENPYDGADDWTT